MSEYVYAGLTSQTIDIFLQDSSSAVGAGLTGLVFNSAGLTLYYRKGSTGTPTAITLATQTVGGAWTSGGFVAVDGTNMPGVHRLDIPDAAVDALGFVTLYFRGATNLLATALRIDCRAITADLVDAPNATAVTAIQNGLATPTNITAATGIVLSGVTHTGAVIPRVTLVDTTTTNTDMRGTDGANTTAPATPANVSAVTTTLAALLPVALVGGRIDASVGAVATDAINAAAIAADAVTEIQVGLATTLELAKVPKVGGTHVYTQVSANSAAKTANVSISDVV